jgi:hypothetical protein
MDDVYKKDCDTQSFPLGLCLKLGVRTVTVFAVLGRGFVEQYLLAFHLAEELMAVATADVFVGSRQREGRALVMIEKRGLPPGGGMTAGAGGIAPGLGELTAVNVGMAFLALRRGLGEVHVGELHFEVRRPVAVNASHGSMRAEESEPGPVVIEARDILPVPGGMAGFAAGGCAVGAERLHALGKLAAVRVLVTGGAGKIREVINGGGLVAGRCGRGLSLHGHRSGEQRRPREGRCRLVAIAAQDSQMAAGELEAGLFVLGEPKCRRLESLDRVALLALIQPGRSGELRLVLVVVAVQATGELDLIKRVSALRDVALGAPEFRVLTLERVCGGGVRLRIELGRVPAVDVVAGRALAAVGTLCELAVVCILVAIHALGERQFFLEVAVGVAGYALHGLVLAEQGVLGLGVIKILGQAGGHDSLPAAGGVAGLAGMLSKAALMRVGMAIVTFAEGQAKIARLVVGAGRVALFAFDRRVLPGQWITGLRVIEGPGNAFPVVEVVALRAIGAEPPGVRILVAGGAGFGKPEEGAVEVLDLDECALVSGNVVGSVAFPAFEPSVLAFQQVAGLLMVEFLRIPLDDREIETVVIGVALGALLAGTGPDAVRGMQTIVSREAGGNFGMAVETLEGGLASTQFVTSGAMRGPIKSLMGSGQGSWRDLSNSDGRQKG